MTPRRRRAAGALALATAMAMLAAACSDSDDSSTPATPPTSPAPAAAPAPAPSSDVVADGTYQWRRVPIGGGGFVTGIVSATGADGADPAIYARTDVGGAYRWEPTGEVWQQLLRVSRSPDIGLRPADYSVASIAAAPSDPSTVYVAVGDDFDPGDASEELQRGGRVLRSDDGGDTWTSSEQRWFVSGNQRFRIGTERLAVDPSDPERVYFGTQREGLWASADGGDTWTRVAPAAVPEGRFADVAVQQAGVNIVAFGPPAGAGEARLYAGVANLGVLVSEDRGATWEQVTDLAEGEVPTSPTFAGDALLLATNSILGASSRLLRVDPGGGGATELTTPAGDGAWYVAADPRDPARLVLSDDAVRDGHFWTSEDEGRSWEDHAIEIASEQVPWLEATDLDGFMSVGRFMFDPEVPGRLWFAEGMGVWRTDDTDADTVTWTSRTRGIEQLVVSAVSVPPGGAPIATVADRQGFRLDGVDGYPAAPLIDERFASGSGVDFSGGHPEVLAWVGAESHIYFLPQRGARGAVSTDGGTTWREMEGLNPDMFGGEIAVSATDPSLLVWLPTHYIHPGNFQDVPVGLYVSRDGGASWTHQRPDGDFDAFHRFFWWFTRRALAADRVNGDFYLLSDQERFYVSGDGATTWDRAAHAPPCTDSVDCHVFGQVQAVPGAAGHLWATLGKGGLYRTDDAGASPWVAVPGIDEARAFAFGAPIGGSAEPTVFVHGRATGDDALAIWRSTDAGASWSVVSRFPFDLAEDINALAGDPDRPGRLYVGFGGNGVVVGDDPSA